MEMQCQQQPDRKRKHHQWYGRGFRSFQKVYIGNNCVIKNSIILNDVHIGDNCYIENCIVESRDTLRANTVHTGDPNEIKVIVEKNFRYAL